MLRLQAHSILGKKPAENGRELAGVIEFKVTQITAISMIP
jgi:hypothetical protein